MTPKRKQGRPKLPESRSHRQLVNWYPSEWELIEKHCEGLGVHPSHFVIETALKEVKERNTETV